MFLSRVEINPYRRKTIHALSSPQVLHAAVEASFASFGSERSGRVLWRIDKVGPAVYILVQSVSRPDMHHIVDQFGRPDTGQTWDTVDYDQFLNGISAGDIFRFRLRANPVHSISSLSNGSRGKVVPHVTVAQQKQWLIDRSERCGFIIENADGEALLDVVQKENLRFKHGGGMVTLSTATFEGVLKVTDAEAFRSSLINGIGRAKAYGCGLMTVMRV